MDPARIAVVSYSSTGHVHRLADALSEGARDEGAEVRLRRAPELAPDEAIDEDPRWRAHHDEVTRTVPEATHDDLRWATGYAFGTPARYGQPAAQLKQLIDTLAPLWRAGELKDKAATSFCSSQDLHGGEELTLVDLNTRYYHWGSLIVGDGAVEVPERYLVAARAQGARLARFAAVLPLAGR